MTTEVDKQILKFIDDTVSVAEIAKNLGLSSVKVYARISVLLHNKTLKEKSYENYKKKLENIQTSSSDKLEQDILTRMNQRVPMQTIQTEFKISYGKFQKIIDNLVAKNTISGDYYELYKRDTRLNEKFEKNKIILEKLKTGMSPIQIAESFDPPYTRQYIYMTIDWFVEEKFITLEEKVNFLENAERKVSKQGLEKEKNKEIIFTLVNKNKNIDFIVKKLKIEKSNVSNYMKELEKEGLISHETYEKLATPREYNRIAKMVRILPDMIKDKNNNMSFQKISEKYEIALLTAFSYIKLAEKYNPKTKEDYEKIVREKYKLSI